MSLKRKTTDRRPCADDRGEDDFESEEAASDAAVRAGYRTAWEADHVKK